MLEQQESNFTHEETGRVCDLPAGEQPDWKVEPIVLNLWCYEGFSKRKGFCFEPI